MSHHLNIPPEIDWAVRSFIRRHKRALRWSCLAAVLVVLLLACGTGWLLVRGAARLSGWAAGKSPVVQIPLAWEKPLGDAALAQIRSQVPFVTDPRAIEALNTLAAPLLAGINNRSGGFNLFLAESSQVNAFALPGGYIVMNRGLLEQARSAEEVQGVMAHEMAHIIKRHAVLQLAKDLGLDLVIRRLQAGESRLLDSLVQDSGRLLGLKFSRDDERAADDLGWEMLEQSGIDPRGLAGFFERLQAQRPASERGGNSTGATLLSTHPEPQQRLERLRLKDAAMQQREFKSFTREFQKLREALAPVPGMLETPASGQLLGHEASSGLAA